MRGSCLDLVISPTYPRPRVSLVEPADQDWPYVTHAVITRCE
jgi:hypothetical protein